MDMGRTANRRAANSANRRLGISDGTWFAAQSFNGGTRGDALTRPILECSECKREVFTLIEGQCLLCHAPVDGKPLRDMTKAQMSEPHTCGVSGRQHVDGWDGNWLDCDEARRRLGLCSETFEQMDARIKAEMLMEED
jgi:hypothetical protein